MNNMTMDITLQIEEEFESELEPRLVTQAARVTAQYLHQISAPEVKISLAEASSLSIVITDNQMIQELNQAYRGVDAPTDVLSFENNPDPDFPDFEEAAANYLGDIIISFPIAQAQAAAAGHSPQAEVMLLTVHGLLHLLGFDHDSPARRERMWQIQRQIMTELGLAHIQPTES